MKLALRFIGDPTGYVIDWDSSDRPHGWLDAEVGFTRRMVRVDADKAYLVEDFSNVIHLDTLRREVLS